MNKSQYSTEMTERTLMHDMYSYKLAGTILTPSILTTPYSDLQEYTLILTHGHTVHSLQEEVREWEGEEKEHSCYIVMLL